jgi:hypothetical protein
MPPESASELEGLLKIEAWQKHYPSIDIFDDPEMVKTEDGKWEPEAFEPGISSRHLKSLLRTP